MKEWENDDRVIVARVQERKGLSLGDLEPCERTASWPDVADSYAVAATFHGDGVNASLCVQVAAGSTGPEVRGVAVDWEVLE